MKWYEDGFVMRILGHGDASNRSLHSIVNDASVIGNIHANCELLKEDK